MLLRSRTPSHEIAGPVHPAPHHVRCRRVAGRGVRDRGKRLAGADITGRRQQRPDADHDGRRPCQRRAVRPDAADAVARAVPLSGPGARSDRRHLGSGAPDAAQRPGGSEGARRRRYWRGGHSRSLSIVTTPGIRSSVEMPRSTWVGANAGSSIRGAGTGYSTKGVPSASPWSQTPWEASASGICCPKAVRRARRITASGARVCIHRWPESGGQLDFEQVNAPAVMSPWEVREHMVFLLGECVAKYQFCARIRPRCCASRAVALAGAVGLPWREGCCRPPATGVAGCGRARAARPRCGPHRPAQRRGFLACAEFACLRHGAVRREPTGPDRCPWPTRGACGCRGGAGTRCAQTQRGLVLACRAGAGASGLRGQRRAVRVHPAVRNARGRAAGLHDRRREPPIDRGRGRAFARAARLPFQPVGCGRRDTCGLSRNCRVVSGMRCAIAKAACRSANPRSACLRRPPRMHCASRSSRRCSRMRSSSTCTPRPAAGLGQHDRWMDVGPVPDVHAAGWPGPTWSFLLTPGWQALKGQPLGEIVARQWETATRIMLDDLQALPADDWASIDYGRFLADPQGKPSASANGPVGPGTGNWGPSCRCRATRCRSRTPTNGAGMQPRSSRAWRSGALRLNPRPAPPTSDDATKERPPLGGLRH